MGEQSDSENERAVDVLDEQGEDEKEVVAAEPVDSGPEVRSEVPSRSGAAKWLGLAALLIALAALAIALVNVIRPDWTEKFDKTPVTTAALPPGPSAQQIAEAKKKTCDAYNLVGGAVTARSSINLGPDAAPVEAGLVEANARQAFTVGNEYLLSHLDPLTPKPLADSVRSFAGDMQDIALNSLAGTTRDDPVQAARLQNLVDLNGQIVEMCK